MILKKYAEKLCSSFFFLILSPFKETCFFAVLSLFLISYDKNVGLFSLFSIYVITIFLISVFGGLAYRYSIEKKFSIPEIILLLGCPLLVLINLGVYVLQFGIAFFEIYYLIFFFLYSYTAIVTGNVIAVNKDKFLGLFIKYLDLFILILGLSCVINISYFYIINELPVYFKGGSTYQMVSYFSAFAFGINLYFLINSDNKDKFKLFKNKTIIIIRSLLLILLIPSIIYTGGRGGFILICVYIPFSIFYLFLQFKHINFRKRIILAATILCLVISGAGLSLVLLKFNDNMRTANNRIMTIFDNSLNVDTDDIENGELKEKNQLSLVSGNVRQEIYKDATSLIQERPFTGYGMLHYMRLLDYKQYPHNLFLELLLQGGIFFFLIIMSYLGYLVFKLLKMIRIDRRFDIILFLGIYPFLRLMFSETYLNVSLFWLCLSIVACYNIKKIKQ